MSHNKYSTAPTQMSPLHYLYFYVTIVSPSRVILILFMLTKTKKKNAIDATKKHDTDTGSSEVQISILSKQIDALASHLKKNKKDVHSRRGLLGMVAKRRKHLRYLEKNDEKSYKAILKKLDLKK